MKNEKWFKQLLSDIKFGDGFPMAKFNYHPLYKVGVGSDTNLDYTFGKNRKLPLKNLRKFKYFKFEAPFPPDSVIFFQPSRQRLIITSQKEGKVLKITLSDFQLALKDGEVKLLKHLERSDFAPHSVNLLEEGSNWIVTSFCSNRDSLLNINNVETYLMKHMDPLIMGPMEKFYRANEIKKIQLSDYILSAKKRMSGHPDEVLLSKLINEVSKEADIEILHGQLHFDLHAGNILKDEDQVVIIDWEVTHPGLILIDYFDFYRRYLNKNKFEQKLFSSFMRGEGKMSENLADFYAKYENWLKPFEVKAPHPRLIFLLYSLERTLMYWDKWKENRLKDKKGLEFKVIDLIL